MRKFLFPLTLFSLFFYGSCQDPATRAHQIVSQMTSAEKYSMLNGYNAFADGYYVGNTPPITRLNIPSLNLQDTPQGFRTTDTRMYGQVTSWPVGLAVASTWDTQVMYNWAVAMGIEFRAKGGNIILGPALNFHRVALGGRNGEYITGEDPYFGGKMATAYVQGIQSQKVVATLKHYVLNNQETNRGTVSSNVDERTLYEIYYPAFEAGARAGAASAMCSYNLINGTHACGNNKNLNTDLRGALGFTNGFVMSDWDAAHGTWVSVGLDQDMPGDDGFYSPSNLASVDQSLIDNSVFRILYGLIVVGAFDAPICNTGSTNGCNNFLYSVNATTSQHVALARSIAANSAQLLQNDGVLPITTVPSGTIAVVGSACNSPNDMDAMTKQWDLGNYYVIGGSGRVISPYTIPILQGITSRAQKNNVKVISDSQDNVQNSINLINQAGIGIICGATTSTEGHDRSNLLLDQDNFISQVLANTSKNSNVKTIVLMQTPGVVLTNWRNQTNALLNMFLAGQETGNAWAEILFGDINPSGKLPITLPLSASDTIAPCPGTTCDYTEGLNVGYRGFNGKQVAFPFGHGLSYTTFNLTWDSPPATTGCGGGQVICFRVIVKNTGSRAGSCVVQVYLDYPTAAGEPKTVLRGFNKVSSGASSLVAFGLTSRDVSIYNVSSKAWTQVTGTFTVYVSFSSRDHQLTAQVTL